MSDSGKRVFNHILIIMFENQYRSYVMQNPYMRGLATQGIDMVNSFGVMHPSQTNYITSIAGELCNITDDDPPPQLLEQRTIVDLIEESPYDLEWNAYMDSYIPQNTPWTPDLVPKDEYPYVIKHNPFSSFANIVHNKRRWKRIADESQFWKDLLNGTFPEYAWFTPNMWNDGHYTDGTQEGPPERAPGLVDQLAAWLESFFGALRFPGPNSHLPPRTLVVVTFDESDFESDYDVVKKYTYDGPNQVYTVLLGDTINPGVEEEGSNHYSLLKTIEKNFSLGSLEKNDADANWFQFLWGKRFGWSAPADTPVKTNGRIAAAAYQGVLYVVYEGERGDLLFRTFDGETWFSERPVGPEGGGELELATCGNKLVLVYQSADTSLSSLTYSLETGWSQSPEQIVGQAAGHFAMTAYNQNSELMLVWQAANNDICSLIYADGKWGSASTSVGHQTDGVITLAALGPSLYLIYKAVGSHEMDVVSYNTAPFNVVTVKESQWSGPYDNTTKDAWSPSTFPVAHFSHGPNPLTPDEDEPLLQPYQAKGPFVAATLDGVIHLAHPGVSNPLVLTETFSLSGIMTPLEPISYGKSDETTTSNGYGTLAQAGWSRQTPINGVYHHATRAMAMARVGSEVVLFFGPDAGDRIQMCSGRYA